MQKQRRRAYILIIGLLAFLSVVCVFVALNTFTRDSIPLSVDRLDELALDLQTLLSSEWDVVPTYSEGNEDLEDRNASIGEHIVISAQHGNDPLVYIRQHIIAYDDVVSAENRFSRQVEWVFVRNFGVPVSRQLSSYIDIELPLGSELVADDYRLACKQTAFDIQCGGFFLHDKYIVYLDVLRVRNDIEYVTETAFFNLVDAINTRIAIGE